MWQSPPILRHGRNLMHFDLTDLRLFVHVIEAGNITGGAARAHLSLAAASERLRGMEDAAGLALLERHARGVHATAAGEALAHHARLMLRQDELLRGELDEFVRGLRGRVRLLANTVAIAEHLPVPLAAWLAAHPDVEVEMKERTTSVTVKMIAAGLADLGIVTDALDAGGLHLRPFALDRLVLAVPAGHRLATQRRAAFAGLAGEAFVGLGDGSALQDHIDEHAAQAGFRLDVRIRLRTFEGMLRMVGAGVGIAIVPATALRRIRIAGVRRVALDDAWATRRLSLCFRDRAALPPPARELLDYLAGAAA